MHNNIHSHRVFSLFASPSCIWIVMPFAHTSFSYDNFLIYHMTLVMHLIIYVRLCVPVSVPVAVCSVLFRFSLQLNAKPICVYAVHNI